MSVYTNAVLTMAVTGQLIAGDTCPLSYRHYKGGHDSVVIIAHGFYNSKDAVVLEALAKELTARHDVFMFDFRGHGKSGGLFSWTSREDRDLAAVFAHLRGSYEKVGLIAFSVGASVSINILAKSDAADSFVCVSAPSDMHKIDYKFWKLSFAEDFWYTLVSREGRRGKGCRPGPFWLKKTKPITSVSAIKIPVLYIHGTKDWVIAPWHSQALYEKTKSVKKLKMIEGGPHGEYLMKHHREEFLAAVNGWFEETLQS